MNFEEIVEFVRSHLTMVLGGITLAVSVISGIVAIAGKIYRDHHTVPFVTLDESKNSSSPSGGNRNRTDSGFSSVQSHNGGLQLQSYQLVLQDLKHAGRKYTANMVDRISIGRREDCTICIPNQTLSGVQCEIVLRNGRLILRDTGSHNGTYLNGGQTRVTELELQTGDVLEMGSERLRVNILIV